MPKKAARKRRSGRSPKNSSSFSKFLTFPVIAVFFFVALTIITLIFVTAPNPKVLGSQDTTYSLK